jgi:hypothetical protein
MTCTPAAYFHDYSGIIINMAVIISTIVITARYDRHAYTVNIYDVIALINRNNEAIPTHSQTISRQHDDISGPHKLQWPVTCLHGTTKEPKISFEMLGRMD